MIWDLGLLAPNGTILVDNVLFFGDPYSKEGRMGKMGESIINFNEMVRKDGQVHKVMVSGCLTKHFYITRTCRPDMGTVFICTCNHRRSLAKSVVKKFHPYYKNKMALILLYRDDHFLNLDLNGERLYKTIFRFYIFFYPLS